MEKHDIIGFSDPLLIIRAIACLTVIWNHILPPRAWLILNNIDWSYIAIPSSSLAVYIFYFLSGYVVGYGFWSGKDKLTVPSLKQFYVTRLFRIAPAYVICVIVAFFLYRPYGSTTNDLLRFLTFTANDSTKLNYLGLLAIISTEVQFYIVAPLCFWLINKLWIANKWVLPMFILLLGVGIRWMLLKNGLVADQLFYVRNVYTTVLGNIDLFLFGMYASAFIVKKTYISFFKKPLFYFLYPPLIFFWLIFTAKINYFSPVYTFFLFYRNSMLFFLPASTAILGTLSILLFVPAFSYRKFSPGNIKSLLFIFSKPNQLVMFLGFISYELYIFHYPVFEILYRHRGVIDPTWPGSLMRFIVVLAITFCISIGIYYCIEFPLQKVVKYFFFRNQYRQNKEKE